MEERCKNEENWRGLCPGHVQRRGTQSCVTPVREPFFAPGIWDFSALRRRDQGREGFVDLFLEKLDGASERCHRHPYVFLRVFFSHFWNCFFLIPKRCPYAVHKSLFAILTSPASRKQRKVRCRWSARYKWEGIIEIIGIIGTIWDGSRGNSLAHREDVGRYVESFSTKGDNGRCWLWLEFSQGQWRQPWIGGPQWVFESLLHTTWLHCLGFLGFDPWIKTWTHIVRYNFVRYNLNLVSARELVMLCRASQLSPKMLGFHYFTTIHVGSQANLCQVMRWLISLDKKIPWWRPYSDVFFFWVFFGNSLIVVFGFFSQVALPCRVYGDIHGSLLAARETKYLLKQVGLWRTISEIWIWISFVHRLSKMGLTAVVYQVNQVGPRVNKVNMNDIKWYVYKS